MASLAGSDRLSELRAGQWDDARRSRGTKCQLLARTSRCSVTPPFLPRPPAFSHNMPPRLPGCAPPAAPARAAPTGPARPRSVRRGYQATNRHEASPPPGPARPHNGSAPPTGTDGRARSAGNTKLTRKFGANRSGAKSWADRFCRSSEWRTVQPEVSTPTRPPRPVRRYPGGSDALGVRAVVSVVGIRSLYGSARARHRVGSCPAACAAET